MHPGEQSIVYSFSNFLALFISLRHEKVDVIFLLQVVRVDKTIRDEIHFAERHIACDCIAHKEKKGHYETT